MFASENRRSTGMSGIHSSATLAGSADSQAGAGAGAALFVTIFFGLRKLD